MNDKRVNHITTDDFTKSDIEDVYKGLALVLIFIGLISFFVIMIKQPGFSICGKPRPQLNPTADAGGLVKDYWAVKGTVGDFTGGIVGTLFSLAGFLLLYLSFKKQTEANTVQMMAYNHDKVEGRFFELLKLHRDNVSELKYIITRVKWVEVEGETVPQEYEIGFENRHFFVAIMDQVKGAYRELSYQFDGIEETNIYQKRYFDLVKKNVTLIERGIDLIQFAKLDLIYLIVFFGVSDDGQSTIKSLVDKKYNAEFIDGLLKTAALKPVENSKHWAKWQSNQREKDLAEINEELIKEYRGDPSTIHQTRGWNEEGKKHFMSQPYYPNDFVKFYGGHQFRLGHYFRHIFHTISFINDNTDLSAAEQYSYVKHLRGQFSTNEQILIFLNSLSQLGRIWELEDQKSEGSVERWQQIISDYMIIKNIPNDEIMDGVKLSDFYPAISYEGFIVNK